MVKVDMFKHAATSGRLTVSKSRAGRRPLRVSTLLDKEREGTLYKTAAFWASFDDTLEKLGEGGVSAREARSALRAYSDLKKDAPDAEDVASHALVGGVLSPAVLAMKSPIEGTAKLQGTAPLKAAPVAGSFLRRAAGRIGSGARNAFRSGSLLRRYGAASVGGALMFGAAPVVRHYVELHRNRRKLQSYLDQKDGK